MSPRVMCPCDWRTRTTAEYFAHIEADECGIYTTEGETRERDTPT